MWGAAGTGMHHASHPRTPYPAMLALEGVLKRNTLLGGQHHFLMGLKLLLTWGLRPKAWVLWEPL